MRQHAVIGSPSEPSPACNEKSTDTHRGLNPASQAIAAHTSRTLLLTIFAIAMLLASELSLAMSGRPDQILCGDNQPINARYNRVECDFSEQPYIPPAATQAFPASVIVPTPLPHDYSLRLVADLHGYTSIPRVCENDNGAEQGVLLLKNCASHYPSHVDYRINGTLPMGWWGIFGGVNSNGYRLSETARHALENYTDSIDWASGITLRGTSYGGTGSILQSMLMPQGRALITVVQANIPHTLFVKQDPDSGDNVDERGHYYRDPAVQLAWGDVDPAEADFARAAAANKISHIYYRINGATNDNLGIVDLDFFRYCDEYKIACFGTWHTGGHNTSEPGVNLPFTALYTAPEMDVKLGQLLPVFTHSSANNWGARGHYNLGLSWNSSGIERSANKLVVPIRYKRSTQLGPLEDQPRDATFNLTLRHVGKMRFFRGKTLYWTLGSKSGTTTVSLRGSKNVITINGLNLDSSDDYTDLTISSQKPSDEQTNSEPELIVYTRQPRARTPIPGSPIQEAANWQHASDVGRINGGLAEADLVLDDMRGNVEVIHNCTATPEICVAHEARVSPDGKRIAYSVGYGNTLNEVQLDRVGLGIYEIPSLTHARIWIYEVESGFSYPVPNAPDGTIDRQPEWLNNDTIVFSSNAGDTYPYKNQIPAHAGEGRCFNAPYCVSQEYGYGEAGRSMQIWKMKIDGTDAHNLTPHEQMALSPTVMSNGDILYSCWNAHGNRSHDGPTSIGPSTSKNKWWLCRMDGNGADSSVVLNAHKSGTLATKEYLPARITGGEGRSQLRAIRSVAEIFKEKLAITNYYRANHVGSMGIIFGMDYDEPHVEGCSTQACFPDAPGNSTRPGSGRYVPSSLRPITPYGNDQDRIGRRDELNRALGKAGYPAPLSKTEYLITHARGSCYEGVLPEQANKQWHGGEPTCQKAIYRVKVPMVTDPFDTAQMEMVAGGDEWQAFDARAVVPYQTIFDQPMPVQPEPINENQGCFLQVVDARKAELASPQPYDWMKTLYEQCSTQGCGVATEVPNFYANNVAALTVYLPEMWDFTYRGDYRQEYAANVNNMGHKSISILGSAPLEADGSVKMQVPCETPLLMAGTDANGLSIAHDEMLHSLRQGETRTCHGCHDGHSEERAAELGGASAASRFASTLAARTNPPLPQAQEPVTFNDVKPILQTHCQSCHSDMNDDDGLLHSRITLDYEQIDFPWIEPKISPRGDYRLARPYTSKWIAKFARDSLFYWKCIGQRADGRTDASYANDIDFGAAHPTTASAQECRTIGQWIDTGTQRGTVIFGNEEPR